MLTRQRLAKLEKRRGRPCKKTIEQIVKEFFPKATKDEIAYIVWNETGFPSFWNIPQDGKTILQCFRKQLKQFKDKQVSV